MVQILEEEPDQGWMEMTNSVWDILGLKSPEDVSSGQLNLTSRTQKIWTRDNEFQHINLYVENGSMEEV